MKETSPLISIIIPVYNSEKYIAQCLDSVVNQTLKDIEIICVNDGSTDGTLNILQEYALKDNRIKTINQKKSGVSSARNAGFKISSGEFIYFLDSDDFIHKNLLEITYHFAEKYSADMVCFDYQDFSNENGIKLKRSGIDIKKTDFIISNNPLTLFETGRKFKIHSYSWLRIIRKKTFENIGFPEEMSRFSDLAYSLSLMRKRPKTVVIDEKLCYYRKNKQGLSATADAEKKIYNFSKIFDAVLELYKDAPQSDIKRIKTVVFRRLKEMLKDILKMQDAAKQKELFTKLGKLLKRLKEKKMFALPSFSFSNIRWFIRLNNIKTD